MVRVRRGWIDIHFGLDWHSTQRFEVAADDDQGRHRDARQHVAEAAVGKTEIVPFLLQTALEDRGAKHSGAANFTAHVIVDGRLVTGQNPASATGVANAILDILSPPR